MYNKNIKGENKKNCLPISNNLIYYERNNSSLIQCTSEIVTRDNKMTYKTILFKVSKKITYFDILGHVHVNIFQSLQLSIYE